jgi:predicted peptidase
MIFIVDSRLQPGKVIVKNLGSYYLLCLIFLTGCTLPFVKLNGGSKDQTPAADQTINAAQVEATEISLLPTGVHLQASLDLSGGLDGKPASHEQMDYLLYLPDGYHQDPDREWPFILFLHGAGDQDNDSGFLMSFGLPGVLYLQEQPEEFPFVVVSPQAFPDTPWWSGDTLDVLNALLDEVISKYRIDESRVYLTGLSMGGYGSWFLASTYPERFAAMVSISGSGYRMPLPPDEELICKLDSVPVWGIHGANDTISAPEASEFHLRFLESVCDGEVKWTLYNDESHLSAFERAYRDPDLYSWLLDYSK